MTLVCSTLWGASRGCSLRVVTICRLSYRGRTSTPGYASESAFDSLEGRHHTYHLRVSLVNWRPAATPCGRGRPAYCGCCSGLGSFRKLSICSLTRARPLSSPRFTWYSLMTMTRILTHSPQQGAQMLALTWVSSLPKNRGSVIASPWLPQRTHWTWAIPRHLRRDSSTAFGGKDNRPDLNAAQPRLRDFSPARPGRAETRPFPMGSRRRSTYLDASEGSC